MKHSSPLPAQPPLLATYVTTASPPSWHDFRQQERAAYDELCIELNIRQRGLCAFCELNFVTTAQTPAREVEHWRPKSLDVPPSVVYTFGIDNLQLGCLGGSQRHPVADVDRTGDPPPGPNRSCGAWKGNANPDDGVSGILPYRPQEIPESPAMFSVDTDGLLRPIPNCAEFNLNSDRLWATIDFLGLNCTRLKLARKKIRDSLDAALTEYLEIEIESGAEADSDKQFSSALLKLVQDTAPDRAENLPQFITTIRAFFGHAFDNVLFPAAGWATGP
ncbi:hypothetical protein [Methylobacterium fujisawaense]